MLGRRQVPLTGRQFAIISRLVVLHLDQRAVDVPPDQLREAERYLVGVDGAELVELSQHLTEASVLMRAEAASSIPQPSGSTSM